MLYFYSAKMFYSDVINKFDCTCSGVIAANQHIETIEQFDCLFVELKSKIFNDHFSKKFPYASLSDCELIILSLNQL